MATATMAETFIAEVVSRLGWKIDVSDDDDVGPDAVCSDWRVSLTSEHRIDDGHGDAGVAGPPQLRTSQMMPAAKMADHTGRCRADFLARFMVTMMVTTPDDYAGEAGTDPHSWT